MSQPPEIRTVQPTAIATYSALLWAGDADDEALIWMAERFGWKIEGMRDSVRKGRCLALVGRNKKRYMVASGEWVIALGANGSLTVITDKQYRQSYREVSV